MIVSIPKETAPGEGRVAVVPRAAGELVRRGLEVVLESGAGERASFTDGDYEKQGARVEPDAAGVWGRGDVVLKVQGPAPRGGDETGGHELDLMKENATLISFIFPASNADLIRRLVDRRITCFAMDLMPRITRAQSMDALSSMSSIAGYKAVLVAANLLPRIFPMMMTAAGTITPAKVLVLGAGVAGLQAIATARRLGATVEAFDIRPEVREQIESLGGRFVAADLEVRDASGAGGYAREQTEETQGRIRRVLSEHVSKADVVITTALVPGKRAPLLVSREMAEGMRRGSVIVDLAGEQGGNCELTRAGEVTVEGGVTITGPVNLPGEVAVHASEMYSRNITSYLGHLVKEGRLDLDLDDELTSGPLITRDGEVVHPAARAALEDQQGGNG